MFSDREAITENASPQATDLCGYIALDAWRSSLAREVWVTKTAFLHLYLRSPSILDIHLYD